MNEDGVGSAPSVMSRWVGATTLGWLLGFVVTVVLAIAWDQIGGGAQFMVGVGMGAGVGLGQGRVVRIRGIRTRSWFFATTAGMGLPFILWDLASLVGAQALFSLPVCAVAGGILVGVFQSRLLRHGHEHTAYWILASLVGWGLPVAAIVLGDAGVLSVASPVIPLGAMLLGGSILGAVTGQAWVRMPSPAAG